MTSHKSGCSAEDSAMEDHRINLFRTADVFLNDACYGINARLRCRIKDKSLQMWYELIRPHGVYEDAFNEIHASITEATGMELVSADC